MTNKKELIDQKLEPNRHESPSEYADRLGVFYTSMVTNEHKKELGQFFTPLEIAKFMAAFAKTSKKKVRILDPGCGVGILSASLAEALSENPTIKAIELVAFETDVSLLPLVEDCFNYLSKWLKEKKIDFTVFLCKNDFILHNSHVLSNKKEFHEYYDFIISNPPYFKLAKDDERAIAAKSVIYGQTNIYTIFLLIAAKLLHETGQLVFITPRSFCSGNYFRLFRELFFSIVDLKSIHLFNSRKDAFKKDKVLQENIIVAATPKNVSSGSTISHKVTISTSKGMSDIGNGRIKEYPWEDLINMSSFQKILHLPSSDIDEQVIAIFKTWTGSLNAYELEISTGPVVDFRSEEMIGFKKIKNMVSLIWLHNIESMKVIWPRNNGYKGKKKGQYIINNESSFSRLVKNRTYVFLRRFSAKDDGKRLIAAPYFTNKTLDMPMVGIENHLNYIYHTKRELKEIEAMGLAAILNSRLFDLYFRTFNGNINVSATELRDFPLPDFQLIQSLGNKVMAFNEMSMPCDIDALVFETFNLTIDLSKVYGE